MNRNFARDLRNNPTDAEAFAWRRLRGKQFAGFKFRRQAPIGPFIADFVCYPARLVVELDGGQHAERAAQDAARTDWFAAQGFRLVRFWNDTVFRDWDVIAEEIWRLLHDPAAVPTPRDG